MLARFAIPEHTIDIYKKHNFLHSLGFCSLDRDYSSFMLAQCPALVSRTVVFHLFWLIEIFKLLFFFFQWPVFDAMDHGFILFYISSLLFLLQVSVAPFLYPGALPSTLGVAGKEEGGIMYLQCFRQVVPQINWRCVLSYLGATHLILRLALS